MKINSIQSVSSQNYFVSKKQNNQSLLNNNSGISLPIAGNYGRAMVNFKSSGANKIRSMVMKAPLEDKIAAFLPSLQEGELLIVANSLKYAFKNFNENIRAIDFPIKKILYLQEPRMTDVLAFSIVDDYGNVKFYNVNDDAIILEDLWMKLNIEAGERQTCGWGANIQTSLGAVKLKAEPEGISTEDFERYSGAFLHNLDYENMFTTSVIQHNKKIFTEETEKKNIEKKGPMFKDVGGQDEIINRLEDELILPLFYPKVYSVIKPTRFAILHGKPGTGKTFLAEAFANEVGANVIKTSAGRLSGSLVGESEGRCKALFEQAIENQPSVIFIDEINALTKKRGGHDVHGDKLLEEFLICTSELDESGDKVIVIGATNRIQDIDEAILRSGRFDLQLEVKEPDLAGTEDILKLKIKGFNLGEDVDIKDLAEKIHAKRLTGADIRKIAKDSFENALNRTGLKTQMKARKAVTEDDISSMKLIQDDFIKAIQGFKVEDSSRNKNPIGFRTSTSK